MSDPTVPGPSSPDTTPTQALPPAGPEPTAPAPDAAAVAPVASAPKAGHTRTILEVVGGVVAAGLIVVAGLVGFAVGHATGDDRGGRDGDRGWRQGPEAGEMLPGTPGPGQGHGRPEQGLGGRGPHDGDRGEGMRGEGMRGEGTRGEGTRGEGMRGEEPGPMAPEGGVPQDQPTPGTDTSVFVG